jgi:hypothetical protein
MLISIHQPEFIPWLPFFDKLDIANKFVLLDNVQFEKGYYQNRCKIRDGRGASQLLTMPVKSGSLATLICEKEISDQPRLTEKLLKTIESNYRKTPYFDLYFDEIRTIVNSHRMLAALNIGLIYFFSKSFGITTEIILASKLTSLDPSGGSGLILNIVKLLRADVYLSGKMGRNYLDESSFQASRVQVNYHDYHFVSYPQPLESNFIPGLSALDLLFNCGKDGLKFIRQGRTYGKAIES